MRFVVSLDLTEKWFFICIFFICLVLKLTFIQSKTLGRQLKGISAGNNLQALYYLSLFFFVTSFLFFFYLWWILSYIEMKQPWVYICSPSQSPLPPPSPPDPSRSSQCTRSECLSHASNLGW